MTGENGDTVLEVGVKILFKNSEGNYLLLKRNPRKYPEVGAKWDIIGGRIDAGQSLLENLKREIKEETSLSYEGSPTLIAAQDILRVPGKHVVRLTYTGTLSGEPKINDESLEFRWFDGEEIKQMDEAALDSYFRELVQGSILNL